MIKSLGVRSWRADIIESAERVEKLQVRVGFVFFAVLTAQIPLKPDQTPQNDVHLGHNGHV